MAPRKVVGHGHNAWMFMDTAMQAEAEQLAAGVVAPHIAASLAPLFARQPHGKAPGSDTCADLSESICARTGRDPLLLRSHALTRVSCGSAARGLAQPQLLQVGMRRHRFLPNAPCALDMHELHQSPCARPACMPLCLLQCACQAKDTGSCSDGWD